MPETFHQMRDVPCRRFIHKVTLQLPTDTKNTTTGEFVPTYTDLCDRWASIEPMTAREIYQAHDVEADVTHRITMYADSVSRNMSTKYRIRYGSRFFNIFQIRNVQERNRMLEIVVKEQV
jgi:SPP1 family predicted phage head-tail adaptor